MENKIDFRTVEKGIPEYPNIICTESQTNGTEGLVIHDFKI